MLTQKDLDEVEEIVDDKVKERTSNLPTKDEFFGKMDEVMGELKAIRENQDILSGVQEKVNDNRERIENIETKLQVQAS